MFDARSEIAQSDYMGLGPPSSGDKWRKAMACTASTCVEVRLGADGVDLRDSKQGNESGIIHFCSASWFEFLSAVSSCLHVNIAGVEIHADQLGDVTLIDGATRLWFDAEEWRAFRAGVVDGEFGLVDRVYEEATR